MFSNRSLYLFLAVSSFGSALPSKKNIDTVIHPIVDGTVTSSKADLVTHVAACKGDLFSLIAQASSVAGLVKGLGKQVMVGFGETLDENAKFIDVIRSGRADVDKDLVVSRIVAELKASAVMCFFDMKQFFLLTKQFLPVMASGMPVVGNQSGAEMGAVLLKALLSILEDPSIKIDAGIAMLVLGGVVATIAMGRFDYLIFKADATTRSLDVNALVQDVSEKLESVGASVVKRLLAESLAFINACSPGDLEKIVKANIEEQLHLKTYGLFLGQANQAIRASIVERVYAQSPLATIVPALEQVFVS